MKLIECVNEETGQQAATEYIEGDEQVKCVYNTCYISNLNITEFGLCKEHWM